MNKNQEWITENFESLVSEYGGKYIGVANEEVIAADLTPKAVLEQAKRKGQNEEDVSLLKVPTEEELVCVL
jgi:ribosome biogenesis SPOUT family RNA methylase Rps3